MHGRPRKALKPEAEAASAIKAEKLRNLQSAFLQNHINKIYTKEALAVSAKLLESNPEVYTGWNYRKLAVEHQLSQLHSGSESESDPEDVKKILDEELRVVEVALRTNFKSYGAWHHRKWVLSKGQSSLDHELKLLDEFQKIDSRNFHAWNYRRFVADLMKISEEKELQYTTNMIETNLSNYSAWHNRSAILSRLLEKKVSGFKSLETVLPDEFEYVDQAIFTDPDDQSGWFYHLWLLQQTMKSESPVLVSAWPSNASELTVVSDLSLSLSIASTSSYISKSRTFPLILYFDQPVKGVNSSTVAVDSELFSDTKLTWRPLSRDATIGAKAWITDLRIIDSITCASKAYVVKVSIGHSPGILSSSNIQISTTSHIVFTVNHLKSSSETTSEQTMEEIYWTDENFQECETNHEESAPDHLFSLLNISDERNPACSNWHINTVLKEIAQFRDLSEISGKIGKLTLARLLMAYDSIMLRKTYPPSAYKFVHIEEVLELVEDLMKSDPAHFHYYKDLRSSIILQKETASSNSLLKRCAYYRNSSTYNFTCLRLNSMSLTRIGSMERLLWVQMLDLSHNELQSINGLEALQLLRYLNLSNNKIKSFTALEPLRQLSLKVLNISNNEIGTHSVDTTRYLCTSPLSHTFTSPDLDGNARDINHVTNYWEAYILFRGLSLMQLDIAGNEIFNDNFQSFLVEVLTSLCWLNGRKL